MINKPDICGDDVITMDIPEVECDACEEFENRLTEVENGLVETTSTAQTALNLAESLEERTGYANIEVGGETLHANSHDSTLSLVAGQNIVLTPNQIDGSVTITASETGETLENIKDAEGTRALVGNDVTNNTATGDYSTALGTHTTASGNDQVVMGKYNVDDPNGEFAWIVGGGSEGSAQNIAAVDWAGNPVFRGLPYQNTTHSYSQSVPSGTDADIVNIWTAPHWGVFVGFIEVNFTANSSGRRVATVIHYEASSGNTVTTNIRMICAPSPTQQTIFTMPLVLNLHTGDSIGLRVYQNSGGSLTVSGVIRGFIIRAS